MSDILYAITSGALDDHVEHIYAPNQEIAVQKYALNAENQYGYSAEFFEDYEIYIVAMDKVSTWRVEEVRRDPVYKVVKG